jgi:polyribonucleotide nucleotidyltransferase
MPVTIEVNVPYEYHRSIIGQKGRDVREMMEKYDVHIVLSPADQKLDIIKISGTPACVAKAKEAVEERCKQLEEDRADRQLRSYELKVIIEITSSFVLGCLNDEFDDEADLPLRIFCDKFFVAGYSLG